MSVILTISDLQIPFHHPDAFAFLKSLKKKYKPDTVICMGDEVDFHALSDWTPDPDGYSAGDELQESLYYLHQLYQIFPHCKVCISNHTVRPLKRAFKAGIPRAFLRDYREFLEAPRGWVWEQKWIVDKIAFEHGEGVSGQYGHIKAAVQNRRSTVIGHIHAFAGINYINNDDDHLIFGFNTGCLIDRSKYAFKYGKHFRNKPTLGTGVIINGVPHWEPL